MRNKIGYKFSWENEDTIDILEIDKNVVFTNTEEIQETSCLTPAHNEVKSKIKIYKSILCGKTFHKFSQEKKQKTIEELEWLVALDLQLNSTYI